MHARSGLSLLEVLFSMGILLVGLMGVAAMIPAGRHEILQGVKIDRAHAVGMAAAREFKIRGYQKPAQWRDAAGAKVFDNGAFVSTGGFVAIDPLGLEAGFGATFPSPAGAISLTRIYPAPQPSSAADRAALADGLFRNADDLVFTPNQTLRDGSPVQQLLGSGAKRSSVGDYSWLATITPEPSAANSETPFTVSFAVFYKRDLANPLLSEPAPLTVTFPGISYAGTTPFAGSEVQVANPVKPLKPGQWVMLAGDIVVPAPGGRYARWFRVVATDSIDQSTGKQQVTLADVEFWNVLPPSGNQAANPTQMWVFDGVIAVFKRSMRLDFE